MELHCHSADTTNRKKNDTELSNHLSQEEIMFMDSFSEGTVYYTRALAILGVVIAIAALASAL